MLGRAEGPSDGNKLGSLLGTDDGITLGCTVGPKLGPIDGIDERGELGSLVGSDDGDELVAAGFELFDPPLLELNGLLLWLDFIDLVLFDPPDALLLADLILFDIPPPNDLILFDIPPPNDLMLFEPEGEWKRESRGGCFFLFFSFFFLFRLRDSTSYSAIPVRRRLLPSLGEDGSTFPSMPRRLRRGMSVFVFAFVFVFVFGFGSASSWELAKYMCEFGAMVAPPVALRATNSSCCWSTTSLAELLVVETTVVARTRMTKTANILVERLALVCIVIVLEGCPGRKRRHAMMPVATWG